MTGIYKITNKINEKFYIGSSKDINYRFSRHKMFLRNNKHVNPYLQNAWNKYGEENFKFEVISYCTEDELLYHEQALINKLKPEYNLNLTATKPPSPKGRQFSEEHRRNMGLARKGWKFTEETLLKMSESAKKRSMDKCREVNRHAVQQLDKRTGEVLNTYKSIIEATTVIAPGRSKSTISKCVLGANQTAFGYKWKYVN